MITIIGAVLTLGVIVISVLIGKRKTESRVCEQCGSTTGIKPVIYMYSDVNLCSKCRDN